MEEKKFEVLIATKLLKDLNEAEFEIEYLRSKTLSVLSGSRSVYGVVLNKYTEEGEARLLEESISLNLSENKREADRIIAKLIEHSVTPATAIEITDELIAEYSAASI